MSDDFDPDWGTATRGVRAGTHRTPEGEHSGAIYMTSSFVFESADEAAARFAGDAPGNIYSRFTNPTVDAFSKRLAAMEGGECCVATASGMSAILATCLATLESGDHIVAAHTLFGSTIGLFNNYLGKLGITTSYVAPDDLDAWRAAITPVTRMLFVETPSNPLTEVVDMAALAELADDNDALLVVDNCFCTPALQRPLDFGAHVVVHSATKFLDGQGRALGGAVIGDADVVGDRVFRFLRTCGPTMSPFNAWIFHKALETLEVRMRAHSAAGQRVAEWLADQPAVEHVYYPGLASHPQHELAARQQPGGFGGILSLRLAGGREAAFRLINATNMISITANLGDTRTTIVHPASTTHARISAEERARAGITDGVVRIAVGLENVEDIIADLEPGLT
ncbi:O-succinylhomoserine sulfhydrylase [Salinisphaera orenii]|uniref:O-succinylhomoserine sulfhydrylase n=1 Tax=Salinisphaera orenii YIM 95161 TaxID=1051139 RepID=A0A423PEA7_9GAMM|nr:O-succinylhomoserine sulfhydrylase [Salinisphaera halophila]ROO23932.1 O-succinylhomoserine sulfhydrylase [Salinisphaera halophila YIM 95161]